MRTVVGSDKDANVVVLAGIKGFGGRDKSRFTRRSFGVVRGRLGAFLLDERVANNVVAKQADAPVIDLGRSVVGSHGREEGVGFVVVVVVVVGVEMVKRRKAVWKSELERFCEEDRGPISIQGL